LPGLPAGRSGFGATLCAKQAALKQEVVIVGGGFGGLRAVCALKSAPLDVTLIDRRNHHLADSLAAKDSSIRLLDVPGPIEVTETQWRRALPRERDVGNVATHAVSRFPRGNGMLSGGPDLLARPREPEGPTIDSMRFP